VNRDLGEPRIVTTIDQETSEQLSALAERFSSLRGLPGVRPFDPATLAREHEQLPGNALDAEAVIAFIMWLCPREHLGGDALGIAEGFDLLQAAFCMSARHRRALAAWVREPWIPALRVTRLIEEAEERVLQLQREVLRLEGADVLERALRRAGDDPDEED